MASLAFSPDRPRINLAFANDASDKITRVIHRGSLDDPLAGSCWLVAELDGSTWKWDKGPDGTNLTGLPGVTLFNHTWQFSRGASMPVQGSFGDKLDGGFVVGLNDRQH